MTVRKSGEKIIRTKTLYKCSHCGNEQIKETIYCENCGKEVVGSETMNHWICIPPDKKYTYLVNWCPKCKIAFSRNINFCGKCGTEIQLTVITEKNKDKTIFE